MQKGRREQKQPLFFTITRIVTHLLSENERLNQEPVFGPGDVARLQCELLYALSPGLDPQHHTNWPQWCRLITPVLGRVRLEGGSST